MEYMLIVKNKECRGRTKSEFVTSPSGNLVWKTGHFKWGGGGAGTKGQFRGGGHGAQVCLVKGKGANLLGIRHLPKQFACIIIPHYS